MKLAKHGKDVLASCSGSVAGVLLLTTSKISLKCWAIFFSYSHHNCVDYTFWLHVLNHTMLVQPERI